MGQPTWRWPDKAVEMKGNTRRKLRAKNSLNMAKHGMAYQDKSGVRGYEMEMEMEMRMRMGMGRQAKEGLTNYCKKEFKLLRAAREGLLLEKWENPILQHICA